MPRTDGSSSSGRETLGRARCAHSGKGQPDRNATRARKRSRAEVRGKGRRRKGRECCSSTAGRWATEHASGASHPAASKQGNCATATRGVSLLSQRRRSRVHCVRCCVQDIASFDGGRSRSMGLAQSHHALLSSHALSMIAKTTVACNVVEAQVVPAQRAAGVRHIGP